MCVRFLVNFYSIFHCDFSVANAPAQVGRCLELPCLELLLLVEAPSLVTTLLQAPDAAIDGEAAAAAAAAAAGDTGRADGAASPQRREAKATLQTR